MAGSEEEDESAEITVQQSLLKRSSDNEKGEFASTEGEFQSNEKSASSECVPLIAQNRVVIYKRRWAMLLIFSLNTAMNGCLFMAISPINDIVRHYYDILSVEIEWLSNMCVLSYTILALPATYLISRWGIRPLIFIAAACNFLTTVLHFAGYQKNRFYFVLIGQAFAAIAYSTVLQMPGKLSSLWFPERERATSTSIGVVMNLFGVAIGFIQPSMMVDASTNKKSVESDIKTFYISQMVTSSLILLGTFLYQEKPPTPPCATTHARESSLTFIESLKLLWKDKYFIYLSQSYAIYFALFVTIFVLVNPMVTMKFRVGYDSSIGWMGFWNNMVAVVAFLVIGRLLDRYQKYKLTAVALNVASMLLWLAFVLVLTCTNNFTLLYIIFMLLGACFVPYFAAGIEQAAEMTYPVSEEMSSSIMLILGNVYAFAFIFGFGTLIQAHYVRTVGYSMVALYFISSLLASIAKTDLKRSNAENNRSEPLQVETIQ